MNRRLWKEILVVAIKCKWCQRYNLKSNPIWPNLGDLCHLTEELNAAFSRDMTHSLPKFRQQIGGFISVSNEQNTANIIALLCTPNDNAVISLLRDKCRMVSWRPNKSLSSFPWLINYSRASCIVQFFGHKIRWRKRMYKFTSKRVLMHGSSFMKFLSWKPLQ